MHFSHDAWFAQKIEAALHEFDRWWSALTSWTSRSESFFLFRARKIPVRRLIFVRDPKKFFI
jgi:hypothetical protein